ncbi:hypothetical protein TRFO_31766 [Tritrichomonas foetus]|uniref:Zeta toxin domain-containing protein n=1 Tax=Tritrichomonas foetus TaxID=1144522 RepID=A0A1J4JSN7_9EUKA|nr:hypothetical protein TRFO_31766 [Tritrichomonas foetus]|eukprot:OHT01440.1 hypothetical protein TRFO_31766 [Tritrichomonas foetus]
MKTNIQCIKGYLEQSELVGNQLMTIISSFVNSHASLIVEGVHLSVDVMLKIVKNFPNVVPFLVYIKKENFHRQRFAVRAKYMTTDPSQNRYISNFEAIRGVQGYLSEGASHHLLPKIDNRNIDRSLETMHQTVFSYLKKLEGRPSMYDESTKKLTFLDTVWKRRKQKMTSSKSKSLKAIKNMKKATDEMEPSSESNEKFFEELLSALPVEGQRVSNEDMDGNVIQYLRNGSMLMSYDESFKKEEEEVVPEMPIGHQRKESIDNDQDFPDTETDLDPAEVTLTDFAETTDSEAIDWSSVIAAANNFRRPL